MKSAMRATAPAIDPYSLPDSDGEAPDAVQPPPAPPEVSGCGAGSSQPGDQEASGGGQRSGQARRLARPLAGRGGGLDASVPKRRSGPSPRKPARSQPAGGGAGGPQQPAPGVKAPPSAMADAQARARAHAAGFDRKRKQQPTCSPELSEALDDAVKASTSGRPAAAPQAAPARAVTKPGALRSGKAPRMAPPQQEPSRLARVTRAGDAGAAAPPAPPTPKDDAAPAPLPGQPAPSGKPPAAGSPADGLRTPLLVRNALSSGLGMMLSGRSFRSPAPAVTLMEAQECGEAMELQDSMLYALDGLCGGSAATHRQSAAALAELGLSHRGRLALRAEGAFVEAMASGRRLLERAWDAQTALGLAALALAFSRDEACLPALASREAVQLLALLLRSAADEEPEAVAGEGGGASTARLKALVGEGPLSRGLPPHAAACPSSVALTALACPALTDPAHASERACQAAEALKAALRQHGALGAVARSVARQRSAPGAADEAWLWRLHRTLVVLESCSFACPENEAFLVQLAVGEGPEGTLAATLVRLMEGLSDAGEPGSLRQECLHCLLSVLMNMTHHNDAGCRQVTGAGGLAAAARLLVSRVEGRSRRQLLDALDVASAALGVLINLAECRPQDVPAAESDGLLRALCRLMEEFPVGEAEGEAAAGGSPAPGGELTLEAMTAHEEAARAAALHVYSAVAAGFLVAARPGLRPAAEAALGGGLARVTAGVERCLRFYSAAGAITERSQASLRGLLAALGGEAASERGM